MDGLPIDPQNISNIAIESQEFKNNGESDIPFIISNSENAELQQMQPLEQMQPFQQLQPLQSSKQHVSQRKRIRLIGSSESLSNFSFANKQRAANVSNRQAFAISDNRVDSNANKNSYQYDASVTKNLFDKTVPTATIYAPNTFGALKHALQVRTKQVSILDQSKWYDTGHTRVITSMDALKKSEMHECDMNILLGRGFPDTQSVLFQDIARCTADPSRLKSPPHWMHKMSYSTTRSNISNNSQNSASALLENLSIRSSSFSASKSPAAHVPRKTHEQQKKNPKQNKQLPQKTESRKSGEGKGLIVEMTPQQAIEAVQKDCVQTVQTAFTINLHNLQNLIVLAKVTIGVLYLEQAKCIQIRRAQINSFLLKTKLIQTEIKSISFTQSATYNELIESSSFGFKFKFESTKESLGSFLRKQTSHASFEAAAQTVVEEIGNIDALNKQKQQKYQKIKKKKKENREKLGPKKSLNKRKKRNKKKKSKAKRGKRSFLTNGNFLCDNTRCIQILTILKYVPFIYTMFQTLCKLSII